MIETLMRNAAASSYWFAWLTIVSTLALFIFFGGVGFMGPVNDFLSVFQFLFLIPPILAVGRALAGKPLIGALTWVGLLGALAIALLQVALLLGRVRFEQSLPYVLYAGVLVGLWLLAAGLFTLGGAPFPARFGWLGVASGVSYLVIAAGYMLAGPQHPLAAAGFAVGAVTLPWWGFWLSRLLG